MAQYKQASLTPGNLTSETLFTCSANRATNAKSLVAAHTADSPGTQSIYVDKYDSSGVYKSTIAAATSVTAGGSVNVLAGVDTLNALESYRIRNSTASNATKVASATFVGTPAALIANAAGTTLIAVTSDAGIYRTTDRGVTWTRVYAGAVAAVSHVYISATSTFFIYLTATTALKSTDDGATWGAQVTVLAPIYASGKSGNGRIVKNGTTYVGANTSTQLVSTTDGITWANFGNVLTTGTISQIAWTGTNYVVACAAAAGVYWSTNAVAWTAVSLGGTSPTVIASDGAGTVVAGVSGQAIYYSSNNGTAFTSTGTSMSSSSDLALWTGTNLIIGNTTTVQTFIEIATPSVVRSVANSWNVSTQNVFAVTSARVYYLSSTGALSQTFSTDMNLAKYGVAFNLSYQEIVQ